MKNNKKEFDRICADIKSVKIQGAENIALWAFRAYKMMPLASSKKRLIKLRSTEPMLQNLLRIADKMSYEELMEKLEKNKDQINKNVIKLIHNGYVVYTHCHSGSVTSALIHAHKNGKKFEVYNSETRPLFQGRKTYKELTKAGIKTTMFVDSAMKIALTKDQDKEERTSPVDLILIGADAVQKNGVINKVGSGMLSEIAGDYKIPLYIVTNSLKYSPKKIKFEQRGAKEVWDEKNARVKNPAFELVPKENITGIISEFGVLKYNEFLRKVGKSK